MEDQTPLSGDEEVRDKYSDKDRKQGAKEGWALPDGSYPIKDREDVQNAIKTAGLGSAADATIRKHIIERAAAIGASDLIPDSWNKDGSKQQNNAALTKSQERRRKERHRAVSLAREYRFRQVQDMEVRRESQADTDIITLRGSAIVYDAPYTVADMFGEFEERMHAGCVTDLLGRGVDCRFLHNHGGMAYARTTSGTMDLIDTPGSLDVVVRLDARQQGANDLAIAVERGDENQMSVGMVVGQDEWGDNGRMETRDVLKLNDLLDVSQVTYPCSPTTHLEVAHRMLMAMPHSESVRLRNIEAELRAGKVMSGPNQTKFIAALTAFHDLAQSVGIDPQSIGPNSNDEGEGAPQHADGSEGGPNNEADVSIGYPDGTGGRSDDRPGVTMNISRLRLLNEAGRRAA